MSDPPQRRKAAAAHDSLMPISTKALTAVALSGTSGIAEVSVIVEDVFGGVDEGVLRASTRLAFCWEAGVSEEKRRRSAPLRPGVPHAP